MYNDEEAQGVEVDERVLLMQQYVDLDNNRKAMEREQKMLAEKSQKVYAELRKVSERLRTILGIEDPMAAAKRSLEDEVEKAYRR